MEENNNKAILEALERLRRNVDYQYLCTHLKWIKDTLEKQMFNESLPIEIKPVIIWKRNIVKAFIELPDDLIKQFTPIVEEKPTEEKLD